MQQSSERLLATQIFLIKNDWILEHLIQTLPKSKKPLIKKAISKKWNLTRFLTEAAQEENLEMQVKYMDDDKEKRCSQIEAARSL